MSPENSPQIVPLSPNSGPGLISADLPTWLDILQPHQSYLLPSPFMRARFHFGLLPVTFLDSHASEWKLSAVFVSGPCPTCVQKYFSYPIYDTSVLLLKSFFPRRFIGRKSRSHLFLIVCLQTVSVCCFLSISFSSSATILPSLGYYNEFMGPQQVEPGAIAVAGLEPPDWSHVNVSRHRQLAKKVVLNNLLFSGSFPIVIFY